MRDRICLALLLVSSLGIAACTVPAAEQRTAASCQATQWEIFGYNDGLLGIPRTYRAQEFADCAALGYPVDLRAYDFGYIEGLRIYCTADNGYNVGYAGQRYYEVCPPDLEPGFMQGYTWGRQARPAGGFWLPEFYFGSDFFDDWSHRHQRRTPHRGRDYRHDRDGRTHDRGTHDRGDRDRSDSDRGDRDWWERRDRGDSDRGDRDRGDRDRGDRDRGGRDRGGSDRGGSDRGGSDRGDYDRSDYDRSDRDSRDDSHDRDDDDRGSRDTGDVYEQPEHKGSEM